jgi:regulator of sigma E protease
MTILIFLIILGVLVFVHELGHFLAAKKAGVKVDEFGFGYPPRALILGKKWGTIFSLNWIPFGGFVKIVGEDYEEEEGQEHSLPQQKNFVKVSKKWQAGILAAGIIFNLLFAWFLFSLGFVIGVPAPADNDFGATVANPQLTIVGLVADYPAQKAGLKTGDKLVNLSYDNGQTLQSLSPENVSNFINNSSGQISVQVDRGGKNLNLVITPEIDQTSGNPSTKLGTRKIIGIDMDMVGILSLSLHRAIYEGGRTTLKLSYLTIEGIGGLIKSAVIGKADISEVTGPVGIVGLVGDASRLGFSYLLTFTALISINLAIVNLVPFPALDGGRILFVIVEAVTKKKINPKIASTLNNIGFALLIFLMLFVTYRDILKLF